MKSLAKSIIATIDGITSRTGDFLSYLSLAMMVLTTLVVVLRYGFNIGWISLQELVLYFHATMFMLGAAYTLKHDAHVRVDVFYRSWSRRGKARADLFGSLFLLAPLAIFTLTTSWNYVGRSWAILESSPESGGLPGVFLLKALIPTMAIWILFQGISQALKAVFILMDKTDKGESSHG